MNNDRQVETPSVLNRTRIRVKTVRVANPGRTTDARRKGIRSNALPEHVPTVTAVVKKAVTVKGIDQLPKTQFSVQAIRNFCRSAVCIFKSTAILIMMRMTSM